MPVGFEGEPDPDIPSLPGDYKFNRPPPPPPGGGPGGGPGGPGFGGFGGLRPNIFRGLGGLMADGQLPIMLRKRGLMVPGVTPGPPGKGDTVPAMLSPGEMVMNREATAENFPELAQMNQENLGYEGGGLVPPSPGMGGGAAARFIRLLLALDEGEEGVQGFANGGFVGFPPAGVGQRPTMNFGGPAGPAPSFGPRPGGVFSRPPGGGFGQPKQGPQPGGAQPIGAPPGGWTYNPNDEGAVGNFDPSNPFGGYAANRNPYGLGILFRGVGQAGQAGAFDPRGNQQLVNQQIEAAQGTKDALVRRNMTAADLSGLDPAQQASARLQALRETGRGVQDISAGIRAGAADRAQSFNEQLFRDLYGTGIDYTRNEQLGRNERIAQNNAGRNANQAGGGWLGQLAGSAIGGWAGGGFKRPFGK